MDTLYIKMTLGPNSSTLNILDICIFLFKPHCHPSYLRLSDYYGRSWNVGIIQIRLWTVINIQVILLGALRGAEAPSRGLEAEAAISGAPQAADEAQADSIHTANPSGVGGGAADAPLGLLVLGMLSAARRGLGLDRDGGRLRSLAAVVL